MASALFRTGSGPVNPSRLPGPPRFSVPLRHGSVSLSGCGEFEFSYLNVNNRRRISRAVSESQTTFRLMSINSGSNTFQEMLSEVDEESDEDATGSLNFVTRCLDKIGKNSAGGIASDEARFHGIGDGSNNNNERNKIGAHYQKLLESSPNDPLLLRNYGKFLHEIGDTVKAEEYYGRAILASPRDGELLSLYAKLIWDVQRDGERARCYFDQAVNASPDDCMVMGSYAQFMWEAEEDESIEEGSGYKVLVPAA